MINVSLHGVDIAGELEPASCLDAFARQGFVLLERFLSGAVLKKVPLLQANADFFTQ